MLPSPFLRSSYAPISLACALTFTQRLFDAVGFSNRSRFNSCWDEHQCEPQRNILVANKRLRV
jgi:hypothetical protein